MEIWKERKDGGMFATFQPSNLPTPSEGQNVNFMLKLAYSRFSPGFRRSFEA